MLDREQPDLVSVCLPNEGHFEPTLRLIRAGVPLLVEKPLVFALEEADTLIAEAAARNLFFAINFNHRYAQPVRLAAGAIARGDWAGSSSRPGASAARRAPAGTRTPI